MTVAKYIGGFFDLELGEKKHDYHSNALCLSSGRACLNFILQRLKPRKLYLPFFCCDALLEPVKGAKLAYEFYRINEKFEIADMPELSSGEYLVYVNYFGTKSTYVATLERLLRKQLIVDQSQAFFEKGRRVSWSFNSARKFFGVPDGAYLYSPKASGKIKSTTFPPNRKLNAEHLLARLTGDQQHAYQLFLRHEKKISANMDGPTCLSAELLHRISYRSVARRRQENFQFLHRQLRRINQLSATTLSLGEGAPFCYPFLPKKRIAHAKLWQKNIFVPVMWRDVLNRRASGFAWERYVSSNLLPLPIDQRYGPEDLQRILTLLG